LAVCPAGQVIKRRAAAVSAKRPIYPQVFLLIVSLFLIGCAVRDEQATLLETNCALPCWNGIVPGETSKEDVLKILATLENVDKKSIREVEFGGAYAERLMFNMNTGVLFRPQYVTLSFKENRVGSIGFWGDLNLTLGQMVELTGQPEWVDRWWDRVGYEFELLNPKQGVTFGMIVEEGQEITEKDRITGVELFSPDEFQLLVDSHMIAPRGSFVELMRKVTPWTGYGNIDEKYPMRFPSAE